MTREPEEQPQCHPLYSIPVPGPPHKTKHSPRPSDNVRSSHWGFRLPNFSRQAPLQSSCTKKGSGARVAGQPDAHLLQTCLIWKLSLQGWLLQSYLLP